MEAVPAESATGLNIHTFIRISHETDPKQQSATPEQQVLYYIAEMFGNPLESIHLMEC